MLTRIALLFSIVWVATLRATLFTVLGNEISGRDLILFGGGLFLVVQSPMEIRDMLSGKELSRRPSALNRFWMIILQIGVIDLVFSLDSVFTAVGLSKHIEVMIAAIVASVAVMMGVASAVGRFIERYPTIKVLALASLVLVGAALIAQSLDVEIPNGYLYFAMAFAAAVEWINIRLRQRRKS
jgi:predicted tellurium resistance membrane protein TerC